MANLTPWQLLLWIAAVLMISVPLISILINTIITGYFTAKEKHLYKITSNFSKAFENVLKEFINEIEERKRKNGSHKQTDGGNTNS